jgi:hypothetical protein
MNAVRLQKNSLNKAVGKEQTKHTGAAAGCATRARVVVTDVTKYAVMLDPHQTDNQETDNETSELGNKLKQSMIQSRFECPARCGGLISSTSKVITIAKTASLKKTTRSKLRLDSGSGCGVMRFSLLDQLLSTCQACSNLSI